MTSSHSPIRQVLEEVHLLKCSLLPGELLVFLDDRTGWNDLLESYTLDQDCELTDHSSTAAHFQVKLESSSAVWFDVELPQDYGAGGHMASVAVKGDHLGRAEQERWQGIVSNAQRDVQDSEYVYLPRRLQSLSTR